MFCELVTDFLHEHPTPSGEHVAEAASSSRVPDARPLSQRQVGEMSEEEQLTAAIAASLQEPIKIDDDEDEDIESFSCDDDDTPVEVGNHVTGSKIPAAKDTKPRDKEQQPGSSGCEDYTKYLGQESTMADLVLRLPDGQREKLTVPSDSKLKVSLREVLLRLLLTHACTTGDPPAD